MLLRHAKRRGASVIREGDVLAGRYRVEKIVVAAWGWGSKIAIVRDLLLSVEAKIAIEVASAERFWNAEQLATFVWQMRRIAQIESEHMLRILDVGTWEPGIPYVATEFPEGIDLAEWLKRRGVLAIEEAVDLVVQACDAVAGAHSRGIVDRDIKPSNLFAAALPGQVAFHQGSWMGPFENDGFCFRPETRPT